MGKLRHPLTAVAVVVAITIPWLLVRLTDAVDALSTVAVIATSGVAVLGAAFILTWSAETAEADVPRAFALAVLAIIAVTPEYAVDALYAWEAGAAPGTAKSMAAADLAVANMTGANRILIGLGWAGIALYAVYRARQTENSSVVEREGFLSDAVELDPRISIELLFLGVATVYAFLIPVNGGIDAIDAIFLVGLYCTYIYVIIRARPARRSTSVSPATFRGSRDRDGSRRSSSCSSTLGRSSCSPSSRSRRGWRFSGRGSASPPSS
ncbi:MAG: hypothetical protein ABEH81_07345 [Halopenitus sp.]